MPKTQRVLVLPDIHIPYHDAKTLVNVERYMEAERWDYIVQLGDFIDFDSISSHNLGNLRAIEGKTIARDYDVANATLDRWDDLAPHAKKVIIQGNHDYRIERWLDAHPQARGMMEVERALRLKERGIAWVPFWERGDVYPLGKANFIHGTYTNEYHCKKHVQSYGTNIFYGHTHSFDLYSQVLKGSNKTQVGQSLGCLCKYDQSYMRGRPSKWQQGFAVFHIRSDGYFQYFPVMIFRHGFVSPEGDYYGK